MPRAKTPNESTPRERVVAAVMALAAEMPWDEFTISDVAVRAGVTLAEFRELFPSKGAVLAAFSRQIDLIVLKSISAEVADEPAKDRLFEVLMRRLDALNPCRAALKSIMRWARYSPSAALALNQVAMNSQRFMLEAAGIDTEGPIGTLKIQGLVLSFARVLDVWLEDEDEGLAKTMAALDRELDRGGKMVGCAEKVHRLTEPLCAFVGGIMKLRREHLRGKTPREENLHPRADF